MDLQFIAGVATVVGSMYGMLKFMLKDTHKRVDLLEQDQKEFKREFREEMRVVNRKFDAMHNRLDGLYRVILDRTYGKNIPEDLK